MLVGNKLKIFFLFFILLILHGCLLIDDGNYKIQEIEIFKNTPAWSLAQAVKYQRVKAIKKITEKNSEIIDYQEAKFGATVLIWAVGTEKYKSVKALLEAGADPNIATTLDGQTALYIASGFSWIDSQAKKDPKYVKLLLKHKANPNLCYLGYRSPTRNSVTEIGTSPLMNSIGCGIEKTKFLVDSGVDINYKNYIGTTAAIAALSARNYPEYAYYLIVEKKAKVTDSYYSRFEDVDPKKKFYPVDLLRDWVFELDSEEYKIKMDILKEFERQGVTNYRNIEIPKYTLIHIKKRFPDTWQNYIKRY